MAVSHTTALHRMTQVFLLSVIINRELNTNHTNKAFLQEIQRI